MNGHIQQNQQGSFWSNSDLCKDQSPGIIVNRGNGYENRQDFKGADKRANIDVK